jgi:hypothetical protein
MVMVITDESKSPRPLGVNRQKSFALKAYQGHEYVTVI